MSTLWYSVDEYCCGTRMLSLIIDFFVDPDSVFENYYVILTPQAQSSLQGTFGV